MKPYWEWEKKDIEYVQNLTGTNAYRIIKMLLPPMIKRNKGKNTNTYNPQVQSFALVH